MSAGAPLSIWRARVELAANENLTAMEVSRVKASPRSWSTFVTDAAPNTVRVVFSGSAGKPQGANDSAKIADQIAIHLLMRASPICLYPIVYNRHCGLLPQFAKLRLPMKNLALSLEELDRPLMLLGRLARGERAEILAALGARVELARVQAILAVAEFSDHGS